MALREEGYWDEHYEQELNNYLEDGDEGEIWFGKKLNREIVDWLLRRVSKIPAKLTPIDVVDIGCGNSFLLCSMVEKFNEFPEKPPTKLKTLGLDYSANSINLSSKIVQDRQLSEQIELKICDLLEEAQVRLIACERKFDYIIDKGTYDAICLLNTESEEKLKQVKRAYLRSVEMLSKSGTIFILASCNHTEEELLALIESRESKFDRYCRLIDKIETPKIEFGGKSGSQVTCLIFELE